MKKKYKLYVAAGVSAILLSGCQIGPTPDELLTNATDQQMARGFIGNTQLGKEQTLEVFKTENNMIVFENEDSSKYYSINQPTQQYINSSDSANDEIAKNFIKIAKSRGGTVKLYKTSVNNAISSLIPVSSSMYAGKIYNFNLDPALIEFDKNGRVKSMLVRKHGFAEISGFGTFYKHHIYSYIVFGNMAKKIEMGINNNILDNGYISIL